MKAIAFALAILTAPGVVRAQAFTGNELLDACSKKDEPFYQAFCTGYVSGLVEGLKLGATIPLFHKNMSGPEADEKSSQALGYCIPEEVTTGQEMDVISQYLVQHPTERHQTARLLAWAALREAFPCD